MIMFSLTSLSPSQVGQLSTTLIAGLKSSDITGMSAGQVAALPGLRRRRSPLPTSMHFQGRK